MTLVLLDIDAGESFASAMATLLANDFKPGLFSKIGQVPQFDYSSFSGAQKNKGVIKTRQPLMIVEDTINRTKALGAIVTGGKMAQSWLGVPMVIAGEVVGAIAVQDLENEHRFDEDDLRLLTALAGQVAPTVRNARLLAITQENAERDRQLYEITSNIRRANSIPEILEMTTRELSQVLNLKKAKIELSVDPSKLKNRDNGSEEGVK